MGPGDTTPPDPAPDLAELFHRHRDGLAGAVRGVLGRRADVAEVLQDAFLKAWRAIDAGTRPRDPVAWVFVLTLNEARDQRRRSWRRPDAHELDEERAVQIPTREHGPTQRLEAAEAERAAREAIGALSEPEKEVFLLRVSGDLSFPAIAEALGVPVGTAKGRMRSALLRLRHQLRGFDPAPSSDGLNPEGGVR